MCSQYNFQSGDFAGAIPSGYIEETISIYSAEDLDRKLDSILASMPVYKVKYVLFNFGIAHPVLGSSGRVFRIDKITDQSAVVQALAYLPESSGVVSEYLRSKYNGVWTAWARTYNTYFKPTPTEIGAAPNKFGLGESTGKFAEDLNSTVLGGFYYYGEASLNVPSSNYGVALVLPRGTGQNAVDLTTQVVIDHQLKMFMRNYKAGSWSSWVQVGTSTVVNATVE